MRRRVLLATCVVLVVTGLGIWWRGYRGGREPAGGGHLAVAVQRGAVESLVSGTGAALPSLRRNVLAEVAGEVARVLVAEGAAVRAGDPLLVLRNDELAIREAQARLDLARVELELREMLQIGPTDPLPADLKAVGRVISPAAGRVSTVAVRAGESVRKGQLLVLLVDTNPVFETLMTPTEAAQVRAGDRAEIRIDGFDGAVKATVAQVADYSVVTRDSTWATPVWLEAQELCVFQPGMTGYVWIETGGGTVGRPVSVQPGGETRITAAMDAVVEQVQVRPGAVVEAGETVVTYRREDMLTAVESKVLAVRSAELKLREAERERQALAVSSPIDGTVVSLPVQEGEAVRKGDTVAAVANLQVMEVAVNVDELEIARVAVGMPAEIRVDAVTGELFRGEVAAIALEGTVRDGVANYQVRIRVPNPRLRIQSGMTANASIVVGRVEDVLVLPVEAVEIRGSRGTVQVVVDGQLEPRAIQVGLVGARYVEVQSGLDDGDQVAIAGSISGTRIPAMMPGMMPNIQGFRR